MDQTELKQKIAEYFAKLPKEAQDVFSSMVWMEKLKEIIAKYNLNNEQTELLGTETTLVLLGIIRVEEYKEILQEELKLSEDLTKSIILEIDANILKGLEGDLTEAYEENAVSTIDTRFSGLPKEVQKAIVFSNWKERLFEIARNHKLNILQMGILDDTTIKIMTGTIHPDKYEEELAKGMTMEKGEIASIVKEVNENILETIRGLMQKGDNGEEREIINNEELGIRNEGLEMEKEKNIEEDIPIPPYKKMEDKLKVVTKSEHTVTDYSKTPDPYREAI